MPKFQRKDNTMGVQLHHVKSRRAEQGVGCVGDGATIEDSTVVADIYYDPDSETLTFSVLRNRRSPRWVRVPLDGNDRLGINTGERPEDLPRPVGMKATARMRAVRAA